MKFSEQQQQHRHDQEQHPGALGFLCGQGRSLSVQEGNFSAAEGVPIPRRGGRGSVTPTSGRSQGQGSSLSSLPPRSPASHARQQNPPQTQLQLQQRLRSLNFTDESPPRSPQASRPTSSA